MSDDVNVQEDVQETDSVNVGEVSEVQAVLADVTEEIGSEDGEPATLQKRKYVRNVNGGKFGWDYERKRVISPLRIAKEVRDEIVELRTLGVEYAVNEIMAETHKRAAGALAILSKLLPDAIEVVYEALREGDENNIKVKLNPQKLKAAEFVLGVFGISGKRKVEITHKDEDNKALMEELRNEFKRQIERKA